MARELLGYQHTIPNLVKQCVQARSRNLLLVTDIQTPLPARGGEVGLALATYLLMYPAAYFWCEYLSLLLF